MKSSKFLGVEGERGREEGLKRERERERGSGGSGDNVNMRSIRKLVELKRGNFNHDSGKDHD